MFIGHKKQLKFLSDSVKNDAISQAYLFYGPENIGKFFLAKMFADTLVKNNLDILANPEVTDENKNQDIEILSPEIIEKKGIIKKKNIEIERVRIAQKNLTLFPAMGKYRILIINDAHRLTLSAQNALLKTLEEPNSLAIMILVTHKDGNILKTVKSRCQKVNFNLVPLEEIKNGFKNKISDDMLEKMTIFSMGKPGEIMNMINDKDILKRKEEAVNDLKNIRNIPTHEKLDLAYDYSKNLIKTKKVLEFWIWMLRLRIFSNLDNEDNINENYLIINKIGKTLEKIGNPSFNNRIILENLFLNL